MLSFNYDAYYHLLTITQLWQGQTHTWASFDYSDLTLQTNFPGLWVNGPANGTVIPVMTRVITEDGARHVFVYTPYGQVQAVWRYGAEDNQRAASSYFYTNLGGAQTDCPRYYERADWAYDADAGWVHSYLGFDQTDQDGSYGQVTTPDGTVYREYFATSGWQRGLRLKTRTLVGGAEKKKATLAFGYTESTFCTPYALLSMLTAQVRRHRGNSLIHIRSTRAWQVDVTPAE